VEIEILLFFFSDGRANSQMIVRTALAGIVGQ